MPQWLKLQVGHAPPHLPEDKVKEMLCAKVDTYLHERIELADLAILGYATRRIAPGDVLLVYSRSLVIEKILLAAHRQGVEYRVIVADAGPRFEGRDMVKRLRKYPAPFEVLLRFGKFELPPTSSAVH